MKLRSLLAACLLSVSMSSNATNLVLEAGLHFGGDTLATAYFYGGDTQSVKAGELLSLAIGGQFDISDTLESVVTFGWKSDSITASNGDIEFSRLPINALVLYKMDEWRVGGGLTYHMNPKYSSSFSSDVDFDDAMGFLLEARYFFSETAYFGGRYTSIDYDVTSTGATFDGNSIGATIGAQF